MPPDDRPAVTRPRAHWRGGQARGGPTTVLPGPPPSGGDPSVIGDGPGHPRARDLDSPASQLLRRVGTGDEAAFAELFRLLSPRILGLVQRVVRNQALAEEITQEVFVEAWRTAPRFDQSRGSAETWVTMLAHRRAIDRVRSEQARSERQTRVATQGPVADPTPEVHVVDELGAQHDAHRVRAALAALSELQRQAIELAFYRGFTYPQVARALDVPLGTIKTRIRDGLIRLRDQLEVTA